jgi:hypothetical protein
VLHVTAAEVPARRGERRLAFSNLVNVKAMEAALEARTAASSL